MNLKFKFSIFISLIIVGILVSLGVILAILRSGEVQQDLLIKDNLIAERILPDLSNDVSQYYVYQFDAYKKTITNILHTYPDILHFRILSADGNIVVDSSELQTGKYSGTLRNVIDKKIVMIILSKKPYQDFVTYNGEKTMRIFTPYIDQYGVYRLMIEFDFSLRSINTATFNRVILLAELCMIFMFIGIGLTFLIVDKITQPILKLIQEAQEFSNGNLDYTVQIGNSSDEIGQLAKALSAMASKLKISYTDLEQKVVGRTKELEEAKKQLETANGGLEERVAVRTKELEEFKKNLESSILQRTTELNQKISDLEIMNKAMIGRELKMIELKEEIAKLKGEPIQTSTTENDRTG